MLPANGASLLPLMWCALCRSCLVARATVVPRHNRLVCSTNFQHEDVSVGRPVISWYPGHIAKAERLMTEVLSMVDVVVELRDARIPRATAHPMLAQWVGTRRQVLVLNRADAVPERALSAWTGALAKEGGPDVFISDARLGEGVPALKRAIVLEGQHVNERRTRRGIAARPIRAAVLGYPNVGKSALINRLVGQRKVKSENRPGVTRGFSWIRIDSEVQLLDSPGIIPAKQVDGSAAYHLAMCDDIGNAAYDTQGVAAALFDRLVFVATVKPTFARAAAETLGERWGVPVENLSGEDYLQALADKRFTGNVERAASQLLKDFRTGRLGRVCLEVPPE